MSKRNQKLVTPAILRQAVIGSFTKLNPVYMMKNPVMFVVEIGFFITLVLSFFPGLLGDVSSGTNLRAYSAQSYTKDEFFHIDDAILTTASDGTGRYDYIAFYPEDQYNADGTLKDDAKRITCKLTQQTVQDDAAFDAAMETYTARKAIYEKTVADIDAKTTIIQQQDKTLELHLDQLDTEQQAIQTEMDAVKKVIDKNIEETFKTFA